ncbi:VOC family protein [Ruminococcaceae bacterium OttesenSCG-928-A11]|nr:VOC family protein [Ruminococcaceae bacterium OttesenSCG-928-A11]
MKFALASLYVSDLEKSLHFYNTLLEMPILRQMSGPGGAELVFLGQEGGVCLELVSAKAPETYSGFSLGFEMEDLAAAKKRLAAGGYPVLEELAAGPQTTICFLDGPNGEKVELIEYR